MSVVSTEQGSVKSLTIKNVFQKSNLSRRGHALPGRESYQLIIFKNSFCKAHGNSGGAAKQFHVLGGREYRHGNYYSCTPTIWPSGKNDKNKKQ